MPEAKRTSKWRVGDPLVWDNRATLHRRDAFDSGAQRLRVIPSDGMSFPLHCGSTRRVLLAYSSASFQEQHLRGRLRRYTPETIVDKETLRRDLRQIVKQGYSVSNQEIYPGARAIAAPVWDATDQVVASVGIVGPIQRLTEDWVHVDRYGSKPCNEGLILLERHSFFAPRRPQAI